MTSLIGQTFIRSPEETGKPSEIRVTAQQGATWVATPLEHGPAFLLDPAEAQAYGIPTVAPVSEREILLEADRRATQENAAYFRQYRA